MSDADYGGHLWRMSRPKKALDVTGNLWPMPKRGAKRAVPNGLRAVVASNVRRHMARQVMGAVKLGKDSGVGRRTINRLLSCETSPTLDTIEAVAKTLGVDPWELVIDRQQPAIQGREVVRETRQIGINSSQQQNRKK
jgi:hypothetical protein